jgi:hypothetical protein
MHFLNEIFFHAQLNDICCINGRGQKRKNKIAIGDVKIPKYREKIDFKKDKECKYCKKCFFHFVGVEDHVRKYHMKEADVETHFFKL